MAVKVRLVDVDIFPLHAPHGKSSARENLEAHELWQRMRGAVIEIGKPCNPIPGWECNPDVIWPVIKVIGFPAVNTCQVYVCRHQIQAGD